MMTDQHYSKIASLDSESSFMNILDDEFKNSMQIIIAECIGTIPKNYSTEYQRLTGFAFYPPLNPKQLRTLAIDNITSNEVQHQITERVYKELELIFECKINNSNSIAQSAARRFVTNAVEKAVEIIREKLLDSIDNEEPAPKIIVQRFVLVENQLRVVSSFF